MSKYLEKYSPIQVAQAIRSVDPSFYDPTPEQAAIISITTNPLEPAVVIAGAGSGKTETMASRVVYLVANGFVRPDEILGLTFTRKAAGELNARIRKRLRQLAKANPALKLDSFETSVTTYHSYAGKLLSEHSIRYGLDADAQPIGDAAMWQMANDIVRNWGDSNYTNESAVGTVVSDLLGLTKLILEHKISLSDIEAVDADLLAQVSAMSGSENEEVRTVKRVLSQRIGLLPMVSHFIELRRRQGQLSFDDQMSLAADIAENFGDVGELERRKYKVVLLDEYQDTSQSQVRMLSALFGGGHAVTAVGDPCQSIYTWRGASAGTINSFSKYFPKATNQLGAELFPLSTTFRNDKSILEVANIISTEIRVTGGLTVAPLQPKIGAGDGNLVCGIFETMDAEAEAIANYFLPLWNKSGRTFAVLVRKRSQIPAIQTALRSVGIPTEVIGLGGLIHIPEVADIVSILKIINDPDSGSSLMRHLTGPRLNLGPRDIAALGRYSRDRAKSSQADSKSYIKNIVAGNPDQAEADDLFIGSLIESLDEISQADPKNFSIAGFERLTQFATDLRRLRSRAGGTLTDLIIEIERYLNLEAEVMLRDGTSNGRRNIERFLDEAGKFSRAGGSLSAFLQWLAVTASEEGGLKSGAPQVRADVVQILTVHMSKGAEWDVVAIPGLAEGTFPQVNTSDPDNWISNEKHIPFPLRGDSGELPQFTFAGITKNSDASKAIKAYGKECNTFRRSEEIRLGYVAVTRARTHLLCTTSWWRDGLRCVEPSTIFTQIYETAKHSGEILSEVQRPDSESSNPKIEHPLTGQWPRDPLGARRAEFEKTLSLVRQAKPISLSEVSTDPVKQSWREDAKALINELNRSRISDLEIPAPTRLSTSTLVALARDPAALALAIRRPMPRGQDEFSRRGTAFHLWIENHFGAATLFDDADLGYLDPIEEDRKLEDLKSAWLSSEWAALHPVAVEVPFETVIAGVLIRGRIDAVYKTERGFEVIDWKTGSQQLDQSSAVQLAIYRLAWAKLQNISVTEVSAAFHYVPTSTTDRRVDLLTEVELIELLANFDSDR